MPAIHNTTTLGAPTIRRPWSAPVAVTLSADETDRNLQLNGRYPYRKIQNVGISGLVSILWMNGETVDIWLNQGQEMEGGHWVHAFIAGTGAGVDLRGFISDESYSA